MVETQNSNEKVVENKDWWQKAVDDITKATHESVEVALKKNSTLKDAENKINFPKATTDVVKEENTANKVNATLLALSNSFYVRDFDNEAKEDINLATNGMNSNKNFLITNILNTIFEENKDWKNIDNKKEMMNTLKNNQSVLLKSVLIDRTKTAENNKKMKELQQLYPYAKVGMFNGTDGHKIRVDVSLSSIKQWYINKEDKKYTNKITQWINVAEWDKGLLFLDDKSDKNVDTKRIIANAIDNPDTGSYNTPIIQKANKNNSKLWWRFAYTDNNRTEEVYTPQALQEKLTWNRWQLGELIVRKKIDWKDTIITYRPSSIVMKKDTAIVSPKIGDVLNALFK